MTQASTPRVRPLALSVGPSSSWSTKTTWASVLRLRPVVGETDYVKGNRLDWAAASEVMPWHRWLGNHLFSLLTRRAIGLDVQDSQCGYAAMNRRTLQALDWARLWKGYGYPNDLLSWLTVHGLRVRDVPVRPVYGSEQSGIRLRHVVLIIPFVLARAWIRRYARRGELAPQQPRRGNL
jgi:hypothetical protein